MFRPSAAAPLEDELWEYPLMSYGEIDALSVENLAAEKSHLYIG